MYFAVDYNVRKKNFSNMCVCMTIKKINIHIFLNRNLTLIVAFRFLTDIFYYFNTYYSYSFNGHTVYIQRILLINING